MLFKVSKNTKNKKDLHITKVIQKVTSTLLLCSP